MVQRRRDHIPFAASASGVFLVCLVISMATGRKEAWDSPVYLSVGIPVMCALMCAISYRFPDRAWRWTLSMAVGQTVAMLSADNWLSLWPLSLVTMTVLSAPQLVTGSIVSGLALKRSKAGHANGPRIEK